MNKSKVNTSNSRHVKKFQPRSISNFILFVIDFCNDLALDVCLFLFLRGPWNSLSPIPENNAIAVDDQVFLLVHGYNYLNGFFVLLFIFVFLWVRCAIKLPEGDSNLFKSWRVFRAAASIFCQILLSVIWAHSRHIEIGYGTTDWVVLNPISALCISKVYIFSTLNTIHNFDTFNAVDLYIKS